MQAFHGAGIPERIFSATTAGFRRSEAQDRAQPFTAGKNAVTHGLVQRHWSRASLWNEAVQRGIHFLTTFGEVFFEIRHGERDSAAC